MFSSITKITFFIIILISCKQNEKKVSISYNQKGCSNLELRQNLTQKLLDIPEIQQYYNNNKINNQGLTIVKNNFISDSLKLYKNGKLVNIIDLNELNRNKELEYWKIFLAKPSNYMDFPDKIKIPEQDQSILNDKIFIYLVYPNQGMGCAAILSKLEYCDWKVEYVNIFEE